MTDQRAEGEQAVSSAWGLPEPADGAAAGAPAPHKSVVLAIACSVALMTILDISIVTVALPAMRDDLGLSATGLQWVMNAYSITFAGFLLLGGRAADLLGRKRIFLVGLVVFTLASLACGLAQQGWQLVAARAVQGLGGAVLAPVALSLITTTFTEPHEQHRALGVWAGVAGLGGALGGVIGGVLTGLLDWRWVFIVNVPVGVVLVAASVWALPRSPRRSVRGHLDLPGSATVTVGTAGLVAGIIASEEHGWTSLRTLGLLGAAVVALAAFVLLERREAQPLVPLSIFRNRSLALADVLSLLTGGVLPATFFFLSLYLQEVRGMDPLAAGVALLPPALGITTGSQLAPRLMHRLSYRSVYLTGACLTSVSLVWLSFLSADGVYWVQILIPSFLAMVGFGISGLPLMAAATTGAGPEHAGLASGLLNASRQVGGAVGLAVLVSVAASVTASLSSAGGAGSAESLTRGFGVALLAGAAIVLVAGLLGLALPRRIPPAATPAVTGRHEHDRKLR